jgi:hypothetical protein
LDNYSKYLTSKICYDHEDYADVRDRCFSSLPVNPISNILHRGFKTNKDIFALDNLGLWSSKNHWFISKCLLDVIYNTIPENIRVPASNISFGKLCVKKKIETIIIGGLEYMTLDDFQVALGSDNVKYEDSIGFCWGWYNKRLCPSSSTIWYCNCW